jgi:hypothetical protein
MTRMNRIFFLICFYSACLLLCSDAIAQSKDEIINLHNQAIGLPVIEDINTLCIYGKRESSSYGRTSIHEFFTGIKKPNLIYTEYNYIDYKLISGYDGTRFWTNTGFTHERNMDVIISRVKANLEGLNTYLEKDQIKSVGRTTMEDIEFIIVSVETENEYTVIFYLDIENYLIKKIQFHLTDPATGDVYTNERRYSDFRNINGIVIPFTEESYYNKILSGIYRISNIELNCEIDDIF